MLPIAKLSRDEARRLDGLLFDLDDTADYPERHAEAFGLATPLAVDAFNNAAEVETQKTAWNANERRRCET